MDKTTNTLNWFEVPVADFDRAKKFYETVFGVELFVMDFGGFKMGLFPSEPGNGKLTGAICHGEWYKPSQDGALVYFNANPDLSDCLARVEKAGGKVIRPKTQISPEYGNMAMFIDSEGNRVAMHSQK
ncbi:MAG TPA: VOC family protein [Bacteroidia bacterium]|jgi:predicted enzyme related to lactoylglutathione lyase|nr:VOC family protein [Bacteroidia bacterium]